ncbi:hypothetical protein [Massilia sp. CF038]|uniref:hypothetical protein n=1 Tax=Massilia sp. CF038 TaxID=1881045 RepID=UPI00090FC178|nr:hypothetical protein [Massilia sp. CF038]SHH01889.1 ABC-2 type transport system permease protein [Massilia sp. CF038]
MKTMKWLLRREFWEHKGSMAWAPLIVSAVMVLLVGSMVAFGASQGKLTGNTTIVRDDNGVTTTSFQSIPPEKLQEVADAVANMYLGGALPLFIMMGFIGFFYCLSALHDERRDRSILFWKSLPVSDTQTVAAKVLTAAVVIPLITAAIGILVSLILLILVGIVFAVNGINMFGLVLGNRDFYFAPLRLLGLLPVYLIWALPTIGWLMMVSAWARSKVFLWAVGTPVILVVIVKWAEYILKTGVNIDWLVENVIARGLVGLFPGNWFPLTDASPEQMVNEHSLTVAGDMFSQSWMTLATPHAWFGAAIGAAMIYAAIRLRRWKDEG